MYKTRRDCESALRGKREQKVRIEMSPKADRAKIPVLDREIDEVSHQRVPLLTYYSCFSDNVVRLSVCSSAGTQSRRE